MRSSLSRLFLLLTVMVPVTLPAATPVSGTVTETSGPLSYTAGPFTGPNTSPVPQLDRGPRCSNPVQPCDDFALTVTLPAGYGAAHPSVAVRVSLSWTDSGTTKSDYDLYVYKNPDFACTPTDCSVTNGTQTADHQSQTSRNPEVAVVGPLVDGSQKFTVKIVPFTPSLETLHVLIELLPGGPEQRGPFGSADPAVPGVPRYQNFIAPVNSSAETGSGEFNIGFNPHSHRIMAMNIGPIWRLTPREVADPSMPAACEAVWEDKSTNTVNVGVDPILWTDPVSGRTFASNSTAGASPVYAFTDNDGDTWVEGSVSPPNASDDHETIGSGPYPAALSILSTPVNMGQAVYYCAQTYPVGAAMCQRSDTLGASYGPGLSIYDGNTTQCRGLHGHVHVAPDGTVWVPAKNCRGVQGGTVSTDAGTTWKEFLVPDSRTQAAGADPSIAIDAGSTAYFCYINNEVVPPGSQPEGHVHVKVSKDGGATWINDFDIGASHGIKNAIHPEAVGGSAGRAACGFVGTNFGGDYQSPAFPGRWYTFIATTYDGGKSWVTVNATPDDPVQGEGGVWQGGGSHANRNLLDFNEVTVDDKGRVIYGYGDGCIDACIHDPAHNSFVANMGISRQSGGKSLFASADGVIEPVVAKPACLAGTRDPIASYLTWKTPDHGGSDILRYQIFRGTAAGQETLLASTKDSEPSYVDATADSSVPFYYYSIKAMTAVGIGAQSNEVKLAVTVPPPPETLCALPGLTKLTDAVADSTPPVAGTDLLSFQISQPHSEDGVVRLAFTLNTDEGQSPQPPGSAWYVAMKIADPPPATTFHYKAVHMAWNGTTPTFESYTPSVNATGGTDGRFIVAGSEKPAEESSSYVTPFNKVVIVVKASDLGLKPGDTISGFLGAVSQTEPGVARATALYDQMPNSLGFISNYTLTGNDFCLQVVDCTPVVTAPSPITIFQSMCDAAGAGRASGGTSPELSGFLASGTAVDHCAAPLQLPPQANGSYLNDTSTFGPGPTTVTFQFRDRSGKLGSAASTVTVLLYGDLDVDSVVNATDLVILANYLVDNVAAGTAPFTAQIGAADLDGDGSVNAVDLVIHKNYLVGNIGCLTR